MWLDHGGYHPPQSATKVNTTDRQEGEKKILHFNPHKSRIKEYMWNNKDTVPFFHQSCHMDCQVTEYNPLQ
jgi:hypothetical protein